MTPGRERWAVVRPPLPLPLVLLVTLLRRALVVVLAVVAGATAADGYSQHGDLAVAGATARANVVGIAVAARAAAAAPVEVASVSVREAPRRGLIDHPKARGRVLDLLPRAEVRAPVGKALGVLHLGSLTRLAKRRPGTTSARRQDDSVPSRPERG